MEIAKRLLILQYDGFLCNYNVANCFLGCVF